MKNNDIFDEDIIVSMDRTIKIDDEVFNVRPLNLTEKRKLEIACLRLEREHGIRFAGFREQANAGYEEAAALKRKKS